MFFKNINNIDELIKEAKILTADDYIEKIVEMVIKSQSPGVDRQFLKDVLTDLLIPFFLSDPTTRSTSKRGSYTIWLYKTFVSNFRDDFNNGIQLLKDDNKLYEIEKYLTEHINNKQNFPEEYRDINNIKSFEQLEDIVINIGSDKFQIDEEKADDVKVLYNDDTWLVLEPLTHEAAIAYGKNTSWCTAAKSKASKQSYDKWSPLTIIINKKTKNKWQTDLKSGWFNDVDDKNIDVYNWIQKYNIPDELSTILQERLQKDIFNSTLRNYIENSDMDEKHKSNLFKEGGSFLNNIIKNYSVFFSEKDIENLYNAGAQINDKTLDDAIQSQNVNIIKLIVDLGAKPSRHSLEKAVYTQNPSIVKIVSESGAVPTEYILNRALETKNLKIIDLTLQAGAVSNEFTLYTAIKTENIEVIKKIINMMNREDLSYISYLKTAIQTNNLEIVQLLLNAGARPDEGLVAWAAPYAELEIIDLLKKYLPQSEEQFAGNETVDELIEDESGEKIARIDSLDELIKLSEEDFFLRIAKLGINYSEDLSDNLEILYEWEYKYHRVLYSKKTNPYRKEKLLETIERELNPVIGVISDALHNVYHDWLSKHALLDPEAWAKARVDHDEFEAYGPEMTLSNVKHEYRSLGGENFETDFFKSNLPYFKTFFKEVRNDVLNHNYEELEYARTHEDEDEIIRLEEDIQTLEHLDLDTGEDFDKFIKEYYYIDEYIDETRAESIFSSHPELYSMIVDFLKERVFPLWFAKWQPQGIEKTRERIEGLYEELQGIEHLPFQKVPAIINKALHASHQTGPMMDYIGDTYDVGSDFLKELTYKDENEMDKWNSDLVYLGVW